MESMEVLHPHRKLPAQLRLCNVLLLRPALTDLPTSTSAKTATIEQFYLSQNTF